MLSLIAIFYQVLKSQICDATVKNQLFADEAILACHQSSGGLLRRANNLKEDSYVSCLFFSK